MEIDCARGLRLAGRKQKERSLARPGSKRQRRGERVSEPRAPYIDRKLGTFNILGEEGLCLIEQNADLILRDTGMEFRDDPEILEIFHKAGCDVIGERVRFDSGFCHQAITSNAPSVFPQNARKR